MYVKAQLDGIESLVVNPFCVSRARHGVGQYVDGLSLCCVTTELPFQVTAPTAIGNADGGQIGSLFGAEAPGPGGRPRRRLHQAIQGLSRWLTLHSRFRGTSCYSSRV